MSTIQQQALTDGFRIALLEVWTDRGTGRVAFQADLFDGGRKIDHLHCTALRDTDALRIEALSRLLYEVVAPPHVLVVFGTGWLPLLHSIFSQRVALFRILDLRRTAISLHASLPAQATTADILRAYAIPHLDQEGMPFSDAIEHLLWAVLSEADRRGMSWNELLRFADASRHEADFSRCSFGKETLLNLPEAPAVYAMYDSHNRLLYVGKSINLRRRISEYFSPTLRLAPKVAEIRAQIRDIGFHLVGSELEALLLENLLIAAQQPSINVQRRIAEGQSRYGMPLLPVVVVTRSARAQAADAFLFAAGRHAYQITFALRDKPPASLVKLIMHFVEGAAPPRRHPCLRDWGDVGREICQRYFSSHRHRLHWRELAPDVWKTDWWRTLREMARAAVSDDTMPAWYRDAERADEPPDVPQTSP